jgi:hypothetical protein
MCAFMMAGHLVSSIPQCRLNRHAGTGLEFFQGIELFELTMIDAHQASNMICKLRSFESQIKKRSDLDDIITSSNEVL